MTTSARKALPHSDEELDAYVKWYEDMGAVIIDDDEMFFIAYRAYSWKIKKTNKQLDNLDTWYVVFLSGNIIDAMNAVEPLEYISFERSDNKHRLYRWDRFKRLVRD